LNISREGEVLVDVCCIENLHLRNPARCSSLTLLIGDTLPSLFNQASLEWSSGDDAVQTEAVEQICAQLHLWPAGAGRMLGYTEALVRVQP
jgi:hypothetical protein